MYHFRINSIFLQVYPCNRRGIQPTFGCLFPYRNVRPVLFFIHICLGNCENYTHKTCVTNFNSLFKKYKNKFFKIIWNFYFKLCRLLIIYDVHKYNFFTDSMTSYSRTRCSSLSQVEELHVLYSTSLTWKRMSLSSHFHENDFYNFGYCLLGCDVMKYGGNLKMCWMNVHIFLAHLQETFWFKPHTTKI